MKLMKDEKILEVIQPHPFSFWPYYLFFLIYVLIGSYMYMKYDELETWILNHVYNMELVAQILIIIIWWVILLAPAIIFSLLHVTWRWIAVFVFVGVLGTWLAHYTGMTGIVWMLTIAVGILGVIFSEFYRRSHKYYITNKRLVMGVYSLLGKQERELLYSKITEVSLKQGLLGRIFNYGTVIPITASGLGTGVDTATATVGVGGGVSQAGVGVGAGVAISGSKGIVSPQGRSWFILYGVPDPERIKELIFSQMASREPAQYLQKQVDLLEKLVEGKGGKEED